MVNVTSLFEPLVQETLVIVGPVLPTSSILLHFSSTVPSLAVNLAQRVFIPGEGSEKVYVDRIFPTPSSSNSVKVTTFLVKPVSSAISTLTNLREEVSPSSPLSQLSSQ